MYELIKITNHHNVLQDVIMDILKSRNISFVEFSSMVYDSLRNSDFTQLQKLNYRNTLMRAISGERTLTYNKFKIIMEDILNEAIPDHPEIIHLMKLGLGGIDIRYQVFGRLTVVECLGKRYNTSSLYWRCKCECGNSVIVQGCSLKNGSTQSCGCYAKERASMTHTIHGMSKFPEYNIWRGMIHRCHDIKDKDYIRYGSRGIHVCDRWRESIKNFYEDMGPRPKGVSIDRIDNDKGYCKENCRWATDREQHINKHSILKFDDDEPIQLFALNNNIKYYKVLRAYRNNKSKKEILDKYNNQLGDMPS